MLITTQNISKPETTSFILLFCQWIKSLIFKPIRLYGEVVRNWIVYCYAYDLNPFQYESVVQLLEYFQQIELPNIINIWILPTQDYYKQIVQDIQELANTLGYQNKTSKTFYIQNTNTQIKKISCCSELSFNHEFIINIQATSSMQILFDIDNIYTQCSIDLGIQYIDFICYTLNTQNTQNTKGFGFCKSRQEDIIETIYSIFKKQARIMNLPTFNKLQFVNQTDYLMKKGFEITNHPALKDMFVNALNMEKCSICLETYEHEHIDKWTETHCSHIFHKSCLFKWWSEQFPTSVFLQCPNCRNLFNLNKLNNVNNIDSLNI